MASGLTKRGAAGYLAALLPLWGLGLVRLWAILDGRLPGRFIAPLALLLAAGALALCHRLGLVRRLLRPFRAPAANLAVGGAALLLGGGLDVSYAMADATGTLLDHPAFHLLSALGSGLVFAALALSLLTAARAWGRPKTGSRWQMLGLFFLVNALAVFYLRTSATVYVWDNAGYWMVARSLAEAPFSLSGLREAVATTVSLDYNYLLALPISLLMRVFGGGRGVFVLGVVELYLLPALWGLCALAGDRAEGPGGRWNGLLLALLFPCLTYLALVGFVDVAACAVAIWAVVFYTRPKTPGWARGLLAGFCLVFSFLLRRYFLFFAAAFGGAALVQAAAQRDRDQGKALLALAGTGAACGVFCAQSFLWDKLTTNYSDLYAAYDLGLRSDLLLFCRYFGGAVLLAALVWGIWGFSTRDGRRHELGLALVQLAACFFLVTRVQSHGQQHMLLYVPCLALLLLPHHGAAQRAAALVLGVVCTAVPLLPREQPASIADIPAPDAVPGFTFHGPRRADVDQLLALSDRLDGLAAREPDATAAVCASSFLLNSETLTNLRPSLDLPPSPTPMRYYYVNSVDKRDPFSWLMLEADYLVVGDPVQVHLGEENQQIIALVNRAVLSGEGLGTAYERLSPAFTLQDGSRIYVYHRTRAVTQEEREWISRQLTARYPAYQALYQAP